MTIIGISKTPELPPRPGELRVEQVAEASPGQVKAQDRAGDGQAWREGQPGGYLHGEKDIGKDGTTDDRPIGLADGPG